MADETKTTGADGKALFTLAPGIYRYDAGGKDGYEDVSGHFEVINQGVNIPISLRPTYTCTFTVQDAAVPATKIEAAVILVAGREYVTGGTGQAVTKLLPGTYGYEVRHPDYQLATGDVTVVDANITKTVNMSEAVITWGMASLPSGGEIQSASNIHGIPSGCDLSAWRAYEFRPMDSDIYVRRIRMYARYTRNHQIAIERMTEAGRVDLTQAIVLYVPSAPMTANAWVEYRLPAPVKLSRYENYSIIVRLAYAIDQWLHWVTTPAVISARLNSAIQLVRAYESHLTHYKPAAFFGRQFVQVGPFTINLDRAPLIDIGYTTEG